MVPNSTCVWLGGRLEAVGTAGGDPGGPLGVVEELGAAIAEVARQRTVQGPPRLALVAEPVEEALLRPGLVEVGAQLDAAFQDIPVLAGAERGHRRAGRGQRRIREQLDRGR